MKGLREVIIYSSRKIWKTLYTLQPNILYTQVKLWSTLGLTAKMAVVNISEGLEKYNWRLKSISSKFIISRESNKSKLIDGYDYVMLLMEDNNIRTQSYTT